MSETHDDAARFFERLDRGEREPTANERLVSLGRRGCPTLTKVTGGRSPGARTVAGIGLTCNLTGL